MRTLWLLFPLCLGLTASNLSAGVVEYSVTPLGAQTYHYDYFISSIPFQADQELDIRFDATVYGAISNATAGPGFFLVPCCQPNNPPGTPGDYHIVALGGIASPNGSFGLDVTVLGSSAPGGQAYFINQLDGNFNFLFRLDAGMTVPDPVDPAVTTPEPGRCALLVIPLLVGFLSRRRIRSSLLANAASDYPPEGGSSI